MENRMNRFYNLKSFWSTKFNFPQFIIDQIIFVKIPVEIISSWRKFNACPRDIPNIL